jgi:hypothetical protein
MTSEGRNGASATIWTLIGLAGGLGAGWWFQDYPTYVVFGTVLGALAGLSLANPSTPEY